VFYIFLEKEKLYFIGCASLSFHYNLFALFFDYATIDVFYKQLKYRHLRLRLSGFLSSQLKALFSEKSSQKLSAAPIATEVSALTSSSLPQ
jgi:hypothetical protein